ncbi:uncharacterized protein LOC112463583 [Temnothorax curvispinosus]|uniref:Uncharacterized protein LOC112463583 n=1 Tax=Temnothorax curvispinosus TaxID=300111 RepID=A0A6J1QVB0_9HYME|nr:uncharacterized protein LOC112463583 [Temnothorax curvispinosus]
MDDVNINKICLDIQEVELDGEEKEWVKLSWISSQSDDDGSFQSSGIQRDSGNETAQMKDCDNKVSFTNAELEDISDGISVITESDTDAVNTNLSQICQFKPLESPQMLEVQISRQKDIWNILIACVLGMIIGLSLSHLFTIPETCPVSDGVDAESLRTASHNIVNTCKELTDVKTMLNEIKAHIPADEKITKQFSTQFFEITDSSNKTSDKPVVVNKDVFNSTSHPLDQLQGSLHVLSSLAFIYDDNGSLKNKINKTLDIVNNTKLFYDTLILLTNNTQDEYNPNVSNFLQHKQMYTTTKLLLSNLAEKVSKVTSKVYNKYDKERHRLNKKLCLLKSILPDDKFLKQLTENNQMFKDYDKSCFPNYTSKNLDRTITKDNTKMKEQITKTDDTVLHPKYDKQNSHRIHDDNKENSFKNKRNKKQNIDKSTMEFVRNASHKIHNTSQLLLSEVIENISNLRRKFLKQLIEDYESDNEDKESVKDERKDDYLQSNTISKNDILKNSFDNILMQLKNTCPLSTNYCPKFNLNTSTFDTVSNVRNHKTKNYKHKKHTNSKKTMDRRDSAKILPVEGESRPRKKEYFKSNGSTKKIVNGKAAYEGENISSQNKIKNHISEHTVDCDKSKHSSLDSRTMKQDNQHYTDTDRNKAFYKYRQGQIRSDNKRFHEYKKQLDASDWYFRRAFARRNARRHAEYIYQRNMKWKNRR